MTGILDKWEIVPFLLTGQMRRPRVLDPPVPGLHWGLAGRPVLSFVLGSYLSLKH
jgi:hypothetical protein